MHGCSDTAPTAAAALLAQGSAHCLSPTGPGRTLTEDTGHWAIQQHWQKLAISLVSSALTDCTMDTGQSRNVH